MKIITLNKLYTSGKYLELFLLYLLLTSSSVFQSDNRENIEFKDGNYRLQIDKVNLSFGFIHKSGKILVPIDTISGLFINESPVFSAEVQSRSANKIIFKATTRKGEKAMVDITFKNGITKFMVTPSIGKMNKVSLRVGGMPVAHGLGDAGAFGESFNLVEEEAKTFDIVNNGGIKRWLSTFTIFPKNQFAGVFFNRGKKSVVLSENTYQLNTTIEGASTFFFFVGTNNEIYANYKNVRNQAGFEDIKPKSRLFELGWESWDALGWNTNQETVKEILAKFHKEGYPIRWAVTGSGFWDEGGTTTSFGKFGTKFPKPVEFRDWMHKNDIFWMIGLRTNLVPSGGPYYPVTEKRDKNLKVRSFYGNNLSDEALAKNLLLTDEEGKPLKITSRIFPIVPCYLIDGNRHGAAEWFQGNYAKWKVDGIKEDTMMDLGEETTIFNKPIARISSEGALVMARCGEFSAPGTLLRINDTNVGNMSKRAPINYLQYAACGAPNVYSDVAGVHNMHNLNEIDASIRHSWLLSLTAGMAVGAFPDKWDGEKQTAFKKAIDFHYSLVPYLFSAAMKSYETGYPYTLTPLSIAFQNDENVMELENFQWMIGKSVLATPILKNHKSGKMDIYLPEGKWFDWETQEEFTGPRTLVNYEIALDKTPCFAGGDGILLLRNSDDQNLKVRVYAVNKKVKAEFFSLQNSNKYEIEVLETDLNKAEVWDNTSKQKIDYQKEKNYIEFEIVEGHNYSVR
jgi:hypothetical protein